ncbi:ChrR family anti-sigma-E factor [Hyphomicrobium sp.]|uniref:ChrR family anti-sigma-E factor n=1 Tax=Hyphomicrobium sp. TaxID=82 RepID=UPI003F6F5962
MTIRHHPDFASLMGCAAGSQPEAFAAVIASHLSVCAECRAEVGRMEQIGVALFDALPPADVVSSAPVVAMRAGEAETGVIEEPRAARTGGDGPRGDIPGPLVAVLGARLDDLAWSWKAPGIWTHSVPLSVHADGELMLIKVAPGKKMPEHGHAGQELTIILRGSYTDKLGTFGVGDVADLDSDVEHTPIACPKEGCICLSAKDGKLRFTGSVARLLQPLIGI